LDLQPPGLLPQAILCVRELRDPLPGGIEIRSTATRPTRWEAAVRAALTETLSRAARPAFGSVSQSAEAVFFADQAELLACAARDACRGLLDAWWWKHLVRELSFHQVTTEWLRAPAYVPAALEMLVQSGDGIDFVKRIEPARAVELTIATLQTHCAETLARTITRAMQAITPVRVTGVSQTVASSEKSPRVWESVVPEFNDETLTVEQRVFAITTLMLRRMPQMTTAPRLARQLAAWIEVKTAPERRAPKPTSSPLIPASSWPPEITPTLTTTPLVDCRPSQRLAHPPLADDVSTPEPPNPPRATTGRTARRIEQDNVPVLRKVPLQYEPVPSSEQPNDITLPLPSLPQTATVPDTAITSNYGGLFFLLNVAFALGYYGNAFKEPEHPFELNLWDFLALCGQRIAPAIIEDPVWTLLQRLANHEEPLRETDGFDDKIFAPMQKQIGLALPIDAPDFFLLSRLAHITLTPAHIDVSFPLLSHPIEIRMAGLDRDPGWIPAAGRYVSFHFD
jgi:hypothetical protein